MPDKPDYQYEFNPAEANNTAASVFALAVEGGDRVLDLGSGPGIVSTHLAREHGRTVTCVDLDTESLLVAGKNGANRTLEADLDEVDSIDELSGEQYDVIILADVLEHLRDPAALLRSLATLDLLAPSGFLVVSIPNASHEGVVVELLAGRFQYRPTGLLDATHVRFFTYDSFSDLANSAGYVVKRTRRTRRTLEQTEFASRKAHVEPSLRSQIHDANPDASTYQFVFRLEPSDAAHELASVKSELETAAQEVHRLGEIVESRDREQVDIEAVRQEAEALR